MQASLHAFSYRALALIVKRACTSRLLLLAWKWYKLLTMLMKKVIKKILDKRRITRYRLAKDLDISTQSLDWMLKNDAQKIQISTLVKLQKVSGFSVSAFWALLAEEHQLDD